MPNHRLHAGITGPIVSFDIGAWRREGVAHSNSEVPSLLYYDKGGAFRAAGDEVLVEETNKTPQAEGWTRAEWWKLHFRPKHYLRPDDDLPPLPLGKSAVDVLTDFIKYLFRCTRTYIQASHPAIAWLSVQHSVEYILTYPGGLCVQQDLYRQAIERAGLVPSTSEGRSRVHMLSEGEASLHFCIQKFLGADTANRGAPQGIAIIDAGGGTINLSMFSMTFNPISYEETAPAECRLEGSVFVSRRAGVLFQSKLRGWEHSCTEGIFKFPHEFDQTTKLSVESDQKPYYVTVAGLRTNSTKHCISNGKLSLSGQEATGLFNESINAIIGVFGQLQKTTRPPITTAFLVGGFANNDWLWSRLRSYFKGMNIDVHRLDNHIESVAIGAVLSYLNCGDRSVLGATCDDSVRPSMAVKAGNLIKSFSVRDSGSSDKTGRLEKTVEELNAKLADATHQNDTLQAVLDAHWQKHECEVWYDQGHILKAAESLIEITNTTSEAVRVDKMIIDWLSKFTPQCISMLEEKGDKESSYKEYDEAAAAYSSALTLGYSAPDSLLKKWASMMLTRLSADEALIAGAKFRFPRSTILRAICDALEECDRVKDAITFFRQKKDEPVGDASFCDECAQWEFDLQQRCVKRLERLADIAMDSENYHGAVDYFSTLLSLNPADRMDTFIRRCKARALMNSWEEALRDVDEIIKLSSSCRRDYGHIAGLRQNHTAPREAISAIDTAIYKGFNLCPLVLIHLTTGKLCDANERVRIFKSETLFKKLFLETVIMKLDYPRVCQAVAEYFKWVMFSHTWEGKEPTFQDVNLVDSVWDLDQSPLNEKLRKFCTTASKNGHRWAWSDTCCIDKTTSTILSQSLTSMYRWYEEAAETLVYLADILYSAKPGALMKSLWMTRAWTLQELLASKVVRFYTRDWKLYLNDKHANHKESPQIKQELAYALDVSPETITSFQPEDLGVREKLRLASTRNATVEEDIAYSLIGIFSSDIAPRYGLGKTALCHLLENIITRTGDLTIIAWTGKSSAYNSVLPDSLDVYSQIPHSPPPTETNELEARVEMLRSELETQVDAISFYYQVMRLPRATFSNRCLHLPCITFSVKRIGVQELDGSRGNLYRAMVSFLGKVEFRSADEMPLQTPRKLVFVHPWLHDLRDPLDEFLSDDEDEAEVEAGWDDEDTESDAGFSGSDDDLNISSPAAPLFAEPSVQVDHYGQALRMIARLGRPFNGLLLERQRNGQFKRVATEHEIIVPGVPYQKSLRVKVLEIV